MNRADHTEDFMSFVMTPPRQTQAKYDMYVPEVSTMKVLNGVGSSSGLGELPVGMVSSGVGHESNSWVMPVVVIVVSAMALMTLYAVLSKR